MHILDKIKESISEILNENFNGVKKEYKETAYSIQFACPYCGDSQKNDRKKRAHFYLDSRSFHCYNCNTHKTIFTFLNDYGKLSGYSYEDLDSMDESIKANLENFAKIKSNVVVDIYFNHNLINNVAITKSDLKEHFKLTDVKGTLAEKYLINRAQNNFDHFLYSKEHNSIWILNRTRTNKIIGAQIRVLGKTFNKYYTYSLVDLYKHFGRDINDDVLELDKLSLIFNILFVDLTQQIKVLEGAFDAFLLDNAIARAGVKKALPFVLDNMVFINDYDKSGKDNSIEYINNGMHVFLWEKFLTDHKHLGLNTNEKIDITDVVCASKKTGLPIQSLNKYYSQDKYDLYFL